ncbi:MAG: hypothetical protein IJO79_02490 [Firmicutes bacterium]|nr:hypothetical protein [Bacillota bacterium]
MIMVRLRSKSRGEDPWRVWGQRPGQPVDLFSSFLIAKNRGNPHFVDFYPQSGEISKNSCNFKPLKKFFNIYAQQKPLKNQHFDSFPLKNPCIKMNRRTIWDFSTLTITEFQLFTDLSTESTGGKTFFPKWRNQGFEPLPFGV